MRTLRWLVEVAAHAAVTALATKAGEWAVEAARQRVQAPPRVGS